MGAYLLDLRCDMYSTLILAAGIGSRMGLGYNKMLHILQGQPVIVHTIKKFLGDRSCNQIVLVVNELEIEAMKQILGQAQIIDSRIEIVKGGAERQYSVYNGLQVVREDVVLVHDGARPFVTNEMIEQCYKLAKSGHPSIVAVPVKDTMKRVINGVVVDTPNRDEMYSVQTPQASPTSLLKKAHEAAKVASFLGTDEASLIEKYTTTSVHVVKGTYTNIKLTTPEDLLMAEQLLAVN